MILGLEISQAHGRLQTTQREAGRSLVMTTSRPAFNLNPFQSLPPWCFLGYVQLVLKEKTFKILFCDLLCL